MINPQPFNRVAGFLYIITMKLHNVGKNREKKRLTIKEEKFVYHYLATGNATKAAIMAGYPEKAAGNTAHTVKTRPHVRKAIEEGRKDIMKMAGITPLGVALELKSVGFSNIGDFKKGWAEVEEFDKIPLELKKCLSAIEYTTMKTEEGHERTVVKFKMHDKLKALEMINKMFGLNREQGEVNVNVSGEGLTVITDSEETTEDLNQLKEELGGDFENE